MIKSLRFLVLAGLFGLLAAAPTYAQHYRWANLFEKYGHSVPYHTGMATDSAGYTYVALHTNDSMRIGSQVYYAGDGKSLVVQVDPEGQIRWVRQMQGMSPAKLVGDMTRTGGFFLTGQATDTATWNGTPVAGTNEYFYAKCSAAGTIEWFSSLPGTTVTPNVAADGLGNFYLSGIVESSGLIGFDPIDSLSAYVAKVGSNGIPQWVNKLQGTILGGFCTDAGICQIRLGSKAGGGCLVMGTFWGNLHMVGIGPGTLISTSGNDPEGFLTSFDQQGAMQWIKAVRDCPITRFEDCVGDAAGNSYWTGGFGGATFAPGVSTTEGFFLAKYNANGSLQWLRKQQPGGDPGAFGHQVVVSRHGLVTVKTAFGRTRTTQLGALTVPRDGVTYLLQYDDQGQEQWIAASGTHPNWRDRLTQDGDGNLIWISEPDVPFTLVGPPALTYGPFTLVGYSLNLVQISGRGNRLGGHIYLDANGNGQRDATEGAFGVPLLPQLVSNGVPSVATPAPVTGKYLITADTGAYTLTLPSPPLHYTLTEPVGGTYSGSFPSYGLTDTTRHFGLAPDPNQQDVRMTLTSVGLLRRGVPVTYRVTLENVGTTVVAQGTINLTLAPIATYIGALPAATVSGQLVTWTYSTLRPFERRSFDVRFSLASSTTLGTSIATTAQVPLPSDVSPGDNGESLEDVVVGSADPNDITVNYTHLTPAQLAANQSLDYTIRFQNVGTDTAFAVIIQDTLPANLLRVASLQFLAQSHNCVWSVSGAGILTVRFLQIRLPQASISPLNSQGFVRFRVVPKPSLSLGDLIPNAAHITFDFNAPVATNEATTVVAMPTGLLADAANANAWSLYPNPATSSGRLTIVADLPAAGVVMVRLTDALGREVRQQTVAAPAGALQQSLDVSGLTPGFYAVRLTLPDGSASSRKLVLTGNR